MQASINAHIYESVGICSVHIFAKIIRIDNLIYHYSLSKLTVFQGIGKHHTTHNPIFEKGASKIKFKYFYDIYDQNVHWQPHENHGHQHVQMSLNSETDACIYFHELVTDKIMAAPSVRHKFFIFHQDITSTLNIRSVSKIWYSSKHIYRELTYLQRADLLFSFKWVIGCLLPFFSLNCLNG